MRIRTIKPEFFRSPDVAKLDPPTRLLFIAMWCWADDFGIGETNLNGLLGFAFPDEEVSAPDLRRMCADVAQHLQVTFYTVRGRHYYAIPTWEKHQKLERRTERKKHPGPDDPDATPDLRIYGRAESAPEVRRESGADTALEQGNRGTGEREQGKKQPSSAELTVRPTKYPSEFETFWSKYPRKVGKDAALKVWQQARRRVTVDQIQRGVERLAADPNLPDQNYIPHAATWLKRGGWDDAPYPPPRNGNARVPTADARVIDGIDLARRLDAEETNHHHDRQEIEA
jgi:hypothetical protein